jgi:hypothetical protein
MARKPILSVVAYAGAGGVPMADNFFYLCLICKTVISSVPDNPTACACRNVVVDDEAGRGGLISVVRIHGKISFAWR